MDHKIVISNRSFEVIEEVQDIANSISWDYNRNGGMGGFSFNVPTKFCQDTSFGGGYNVKIYVKSADTFVLRYQGRIDNKVYNVNGQSETIAIKGSGYLSELNDIYLDEVEYTSQTVEFIVKDLLDNYVTADTNITYDIGDINTVTGVTLDTIKFSGSVMNALRTLADIVGSREYGVDVDRKFFFKERSTTENFVYHLGSKVINFSLDNDSGKVVNRVIVIGGEVSGTPFKATYNDTKSQLKWKRRDQVYQNSAITTTAVGQEVANSIFSEFADVTLRARVTILDGTQFESTVPMGLFRVQGKSITYGTRKYGTFLYSGNIRYQINRISYKINAEGTLTSSLQLGQLRPSAAEEISQLEYKLQQLTAQGV